MFEEEEEDFENASESHEDLENPDDKEPDLVLEGKKWADGGFVYGFDAATASVDFLRYDRFL